MAFVIKFAKSVRTHWKKSTFLAIALAYGGNYTIERYQATNLMRAYCLEAKRYGDQGIPDGVQPKNITIILNPNANKRKAAKQFEKYCAPILHLAGIAVDIQQTESEGHARKLVENLKQTDAIIVAGGDGTISEVITGLFRRTNNEQIVNPCPIGILPLGQTNTVGRILFPGGDSIATVRSLADASLAIVQENIKIVDVMKIEIIGDLEDKKDSIETTQVNKKENKQNPFPEEQNKEIVHAENVEQNQENAVKQEETEPSTDVKEEEKEPGTETIQEEKASEEDSGPTKPVYALASFEWGPYRDAYAKQEKYWYWGSLRKYATYIFNGYKKDLTWQCNADINYLEPCQGCSNCYVKPKSTTRWWSRFFSKPKPIEIDYSKIQNERCGMQHTKEINTTDFHLSTNTLENPDISKLHLQLGPPDTNYFNFVTQGFKTSKGENRDYSDVIHVRQVEIVPKNIQPTKEVWFSIDKEEYEARPVRITVLPKILKIYCKPEMNKTPLFYV